jgi:hypothetical protein
MGYADLPLRSRRRGAKAKRPGRFPAHCPLALTSEVREPVALHLFRAVQTETVRLPGSAFASSESVKLMLMVRCTAHSKSTISEFH